MYYSYNMTYVYLKKSNWKYLWIALIFKLKKLRYIFDDYCSLVI